MPAPTIFMSLNSGFSIVAAREECAAKMRVDAAGGEVEVVLLGGLVLADRRPCP